MRTALSHLIHRLTRNAIGIKVPLGAPGRQNLETGIGEFAHRPEDSVFVSIASAAPQLTGGQVLALGVKAERRLTSHPSIPTMREQGIDVVAEHWWGLLAPARTPDAIISRVAQACAVVMHQPDQASRLDALAVIPRTDGPAPLAERIRLDMARYGAIARARNIRAQ